MKFNIFKFFPCQPLVGCTDGCFNYSSSSSKYYRSTCSFPKGLSNWLSGKSSNLMPASIIIKPSSLVVTTMSTLLCLSLVSSGRLASAFLLYRALLIQLQSYQGQFYFFCIICFYYGAKHYMRRFTSGRNF